MKKQSIKLAKGQNVEDMMNRYIRQGYHVEYILKTRTLKYWR